MDLNTITEVAHPKTRAQLPVWTAGDAWLAGGTWDERIKVGGFFAGGLQSAPHAKSLRKQPGGEVVITDGPYLETKEHIGGFWILDAANMDEAVAWGRKAVVACRVPVEVRAFLRIRPNRK